MRHQKSKNSGFTILEMLVVLFLIVLLASILCIHIGSSTKSSITTALEAQIAQMEQVRISLTQLTDNGQVPGYVHRASSHSALAGGELTVLADDTPLTFSEGTLRDATSPEAWFERYIVGFSGDPSTTALFNALHKAALHLTFDSSHRPVAWTGIPFSMAPDTDGTHPLTLKYVPGSGAGVGWVLSN